MTQNHFDFQNFNYSNYCNCTSKALYLHGPCICTNYNSIQKSLRYTDVVKTLSSTCFFDDPMPLQSFWQDFFCYFFVKCTHIQQENKIIGYVQSLISKSGPISLKMRNLSRYSLLKNDDSYSCQYFSTAYSSDKKKSAKLTQYILFSLSFSTYIP